MIRKVLIWLVMALLPLQGYATASMIACGPVHARMAAEHVHDHEGHSGSHGHAHHADAAHHHDHDTPSTAGDLGQSKCSACAACCTGSTAPSPAFVVFGSHAVYGILIPFVGSADRSIVPDGLDRPPRISLA